MDPSVSVVIPVRNAAAYLESCLEHLAKSSLPPLECIVVDDQSTDNSAEIARRFGAKVLSTEACRGPARARNLGAKAAQGDILFFIDSDVCVPPDAVARVVANLRDDPGLDALIGSYDEFPESPDFFSQYKNLMHSFVHQTARPEASTFWSGCGAIRKNVFFEHQGFDESYTKPAIEDIELGFRLVRAGRKIHLDRNLQVKHLKRWSFWSLLKTDILYRGIPWTELILRDRLMPNDLNLKLSQRVSVVLVFLLVALAASAATYHRGHFLTPLLALFLLLLGRYWAHVAARKGGKLVHASMVALLAVTTWLAYGHKMLEFIPVLLVGYLFLFLRHRYAYSTLRRRRVTGFIYGVYFLLAVLFFLSYLPHQPLVLGFLLLLVFVAGLNYRFYMFLADKWGHLYVLAALPLHFLYHFYNGISFLAGLTRYTWKSSFTKKAALPELHPGKERR